MDRNILIALGVLAAGGGAVYLIARATGAIAAPKGEGQAPAALDRTPTGDILVVGDSHVMANGGFADVLNATKAGRAGAGSREVAATAIAAIGRTRPDFVVVLAGINDGNGRVEATQTSLSAIYRAARAAGARVIAIAELPWRGYAGWTEAADARHVAARRWVLAGGDGLVDAAIDPYRVVYDGARPAYLNSLYDAGDGLHLNIRGHRVLADEVSKTIAAIQRG